jgi:structural maintenance of chromosome 1
MDAIVVDTKATGYECIQYLREQRVGTATFLPLDSLKVPAPYTSERLRALEADGRYRLCADVITCDESIRKAVLYAVGNTVVCDDLTAARELCFGKDGKSDNKVKAVTLTGGVISKAGTMTGGLTEENARAAGRWDEKEITALKHKKDKLEADRAKTSFAPKITTLVSSSSLSNPSQLADELRNQVGNLKNREQYTKSDRTYTETKLKEQETLLNASVQQADKVQKNIDIAESAVSSANTEVEKARTAVKEAEDVVLQPFREKTGLNDLRAYDIAVGRAREDFMEKKQQLRQHRAKLESQLTYEDGRDFVTPVTALESRLSTIKGKLTKANKKEEELLKKSAKAKADLAQSESELQTATKEEKDSEKSVKDTQSKFAEMQGERMQVSKSMNGEDGELERLRGELHEILQKSRVEEVNLPHLKEGRKGGADDDMDENDDSSQATNDDSSQGTSQDSVNTKSTHFSQSDDRRVMKDKKDASTIDFSGLKGDLKARLTSDRDEKKIRSGFEQKLAKIHADLEAIAPNMKANDAFNKVGEKLKESGKDFEDAKVEARDAVAAFNKVKSIRAKTFNKAFSAIDTALKTIYRDLTKSSKHPLGGNAYLSLDDTDEPYLGGLKYNAMPPMKR